MVGLSASVNLPLHHKVQKFSSGTGSPGWSRKKGRKMVVVWCDGVNLYILNAVRRPYVRNAGRGLSRQSCQNENDVMRIAGLVAAGTGLRYGDWRQARVATLW